MKIKDICAVEKINYFNFLYIKSFLILNYNIKLFY